MICSARTLCAVTVNRCVLRLETGDSLRQRSHRLVAGFRHAEAVKDWSASRSYQAEKDADGRISGAMARYAGLIRLIAAKRPLQAGERRVRNDAEC